MMALERERERERGTWNVKIIERERGCDCPIEEAVDLKVQSVSMFFFLLRARIAIPQFQGKNWRKLVFNSLNYVWNQNSNSFVLPKQSIWNSLGPILQFHNSTFNSKDAKRALNETPIPFFIPSSFRHSQTVP